ncbi:MAG TPA: response regulator [Polyangia bacterium]|jgi:PAS domain S-box-containing protein|nr:response regulator [Polyangia bacterium]
MAERARQPVPSITPAPSGGESHAELLEKSLLAQRALLDNQPHLAWLKDAEGRFLAVNKAFAEACGKGSPESLVGKTDHDAWPRELAEAYRADDAAVMAAGLRKAVEEPIAGIDGTRWFETYKSPVFAPDGRIIGTTGVARDVTERKRAEQRLLQAEEDRRKLELSVMQAQKLESLGVLAGGIAHDFNNLLTSILGSADLAAAQLSPYSPARRYIEDIERASRRAADLCRQMLAYSGKGRFVIQALNVNDLVKEIAHLLSVSISKKVVIRYDFAAHLPSVRADATQLRQVVMNLITNASEAIGDRSGVIALSSGVMECDAAYLQAAVGDLTPRTPGPYVYLEVRDTGHGMDHETLTRIFDPFFTTKFAGRGLGLAAVLGIVRGHKGALRVDTVRGQGTTFRVLLPAHDIPSESLEEVSAAHRGWRGHGLVLVVDDEESVRVLTKRMLEYSGFEVVCAADGREAITLFTERRADVRLVVLDWTMPHVDGEACLRELRRLDPTVKVIMISGYNEQEIVDHFGGQGLAAFVQKPFRMADLLPKVRQVLEG